MFDEVYIFCFILILYLNTTVCFLLLLLPGAELPLVESFGLLNDLDPGRRLSSFWSSFGRCPVWCYPPICTWVLLVRIFSTKRFFIDAVFILPTACLRVTRWDKFSLLLVRLIFVDIVDVMLALAVFDAGFIWQAAEMATFFRTPLFYPFRRAHSLKR